MSNGNNITIAVMGATGTGKTSFINLVSGSQFPVGAGLNSCTPAIQSSHPFPLSGRQVVLIDTPGFDDTTKSDTDILKLISEYLATTYRQGKKLSGIIYMHRISDVRVGGISLRNFHMFSSLCGDKTLKNIAIVTNMWGTVDEAIATARERELASDTALFQPTLNKGARMFRHYNTRESAHAVLQHLIGNTPEVLQIQDELVNQQKTPSQTTAAAALNHEIQEQMRIHEQERRKAQAAAAAALATAEEQRRRENERVRQEMAANAERERIMHERMLAQQEEERRNAAERALEVQRAIEAHAAAARVQQANAERLRIIAEQNAAAAAAEQERLRQQMLHLQAQQSQGSRNNLKRVEREVRRWVRW